MATTNRWGRAIGAGVLAELAIIVVIGLTMLIYTMTGTRSAADKMAFIHDAAAWIACVGGPIATFLLARWAIRPLTSAHMAHARPKDRHEILRQVLTEARGSLGETPTRRGLSLTDRLALSRDLPRWTIPGRSRA